MQSLELLRLKREKFTVNIRREQIEKTLRVKRRLFVERADIFSNTIYSDEIIQPIINKSQGALNSIKILSKALLNETNQLHITEQQCWEVIVVVLQLLESGIDEQRIADCLELIINISFHQSVSFNIELLKLDIISNVFCVSQLNNPNLHSDLYLLLINIMAEVTPQQREEFFAKHDLVNRAIAIQSTFGLTIKSSNRLFQLLILCRRLNGDQIFQLIDQIQNALASFQDCSKLKKNAYGLLLQLVKLSENVNEYLKHEFPIILVNQLNAEIFQGEKRKVVILTNVLQIIEFLCKESDDWCEVYQYLMQCFIEFGVLSGILNLLEQNWEVHETKLYDYSLSIITCLLEIENPKCKAIIQNKQELFEKIYNDLNMIKKSDQNLPNSTIYFLNAILCCNIEVIIEDMVTQIDFFGIMKEEITRFDFKKTYCFDLDTWLEMIARALRFGETIKQYESFVGLFISHQGAEILEEIQKLGTNQEAEKSRILLDQILSDEQQLIQ